MATKNTKKRISTGVAVGAGVAALAAAAAGVYFLYGKEAPKRRKAVRGWMLKAKGEVLEQLEKLPEVSEQTYYGLVDAVAAKYAGLKNVDSAELGEMARELRGYWKGIKGQFVSPKRAAKKASRKAARPAARKAGRKAARTAKRA